MRGKEFLLLGFAGIAGYVLWKRAYYSMTSPETAGALNTSIGDTLKTIGEDIVNTVDNTAWLSSDNAQRFLPYLNDAEVKFGLPHNLLARVAYQESHFRSDIISGATRSPVGAVGIMQLMPQYFPGAGIDPVADIYTAAAELARLYGRFQDWQLAIASYNWGQGNVNQYLQGKKPLPTETKNYVAGVFTDIPIAGTLFPVV